MPLNEKCDYQLQFGLRPSERKTLEDRANGKPLAAYIRERLELEPASPGRRWPENPAERRLRTGS
jgi:hypothetical protein